MSEQSETQVNPTITNSQASSTAGEVNQLVENIPSLIEDIEPNQTAETDEKYYCCEININDIITTEQGKSYIKITDDLVSFFQSNYVIIPETSTKINEESFGKADEAEKIKMIMEMLPEKAKDFYQQQLEKMKASKDQLNKEYEEWLFKLKKEVDNQVYKIKKPITYEWDHDDYISTATEKNKQKDQHKETHQSSAKKRARKPSTSSSSSSSSSDSTPTSPDNSDDEEGTTLNEEEINESTESRSSKNKKKLQSIRWCQHACFYTESGNKRNMARHTREYHPDKAVAFSSEPIDHQALTKLENQWAIQSAEHRRNKLQKAKKQSSSSSKKHKKHKK